MTTKKRTRGGHRPTGTAAERRSAATVPATDKSLRTRDDILAAARACFARFGYAATTVDHIVNEANIARGSFYTYFESKAHVCRHLTSQIDRQISSQVATLTPTAKGDAYENLLQSNLNYLRLVAANADLYRLVDEVSAHDPDVAKARLASHQRHVGRVADTIRRWQASGKATKTNDVDLTAAALVAMLSGFARWMHLEGDTSDDVAAAQRLTDIWAAACGLDVAARQ